MNLTKKILFLICFFVIEMTVVKAHPFYVSICQVDFNRETQSLEISVKTFADDLLLALEKEGASKVFLGEAKENPETDKWIFNYIKSKLGLIVNGKSVEYVFVGKEMETDVVWSYFEIKNISELRAVEVHCSLLTEVFDTQNNIIQINNGHGIKNLLMDKKKIIDSITF